MRSVADFCEFLQRLAPLALAESWDNVGLLIGDPEQPVRRAMTCLTLSREVAEEAIEAQAELVISHHPIPFRPLNRVTTEQTTGRIIWRLARHGISVYSAHTAFDSAEQGINRQLAERLGLGDIHPLVEHLDPAVVGGSGRMGRLSKPQSAAQWIDDVKRRLSLSTVQFAGELNATVERVALACGSGGSLLENAMRAGCQAMLTGDIGFHQALEGRARGVVILAIGHYASERFAMEWLASQLATAFDDCELFASRCEFDPFQLR